ncbi:MAG TPA: hypothetical protein VLM17_08190 [Xanthomonadaceae bacterium]|nr:hypothetical protein [Xanthomonadaceae bacterium]
MPGTLEERFHAAMVNLYYACAVRLKPPYYASRFLESVLASGGRQVAEHLLDAAAPSTGFAELRMRGVDALQLSVEYLVLQEPWCQLFSEEQRATAHARLAQADAEAPAPMAAMDERPP